jgi:hypothetical protein
MNEFIEKNRRLLKFYCVAARVIGWMLIVLGVIGILVIGFYSSGLRSASEESYIREQYREYILYAVPSQLFYFTLGLVTLGVAQFIQYLIERKYKAVWILRHGDKILYMCAVLLVGSAVINSVRNFGRLIWFLERGNPGLWWWMYFVLPERSIWSWRFFLLLPVLLAAAKALVLVGLAQILRRILPVIEESKTLV